MIGISKNMNTDAIGCNIVSALEEIDLPPGPTIRGGGKYKCVHQDKTDYFAVCGTVESYYKHDTGYYISKRRNGKHIYMGHVPTEDMAIDAVTICRDLNWDTERCRLAIWEMKQCQ